MMLTCLYNFFARIVEALYLECVPVTIGDNYVLPFSDILNWKSFSVQVSKEDIPNLKSILMSISPRQYIRMQRRAKIAQRHFMVNSPPKRYDVFHMILHSIWLRRLNVQVHAREWKIIDFLYTVNTWYKWISFCYTNVKFVIECQNSHKSCLCFLLCSNCFPSYGEKFEVFLCKIN